MLPINDLHRHNQPLLDDLQRAMERVLRRGYYILGPEGQAFEHAFANYLEVVDAVAVGNGTDALELALRALKVGPGDEVITVANAGMYASSAIRAVGAEPRYVDIEPVHLLMDVSLVAQLIGPRTRAVIATHLYGRMADVGRLRALCDGAGIALIEDCAQAHGARRDGRAAGAWGHLSTFSFYPTKNLGALGDGGLVSGTDHEALGRVRQLRQYGWGSKYQVVVGGGRNSRLDELQAAVLLEKLPHLDRWNEQRRDVARAYRAGLSNLGWVLPGEPHDDDVCHLFVVQLTARDEVRKRLAEAGVGSDVHYPIADHLQGGGQAEAVSLPVTVAVTPRLMSLPCFPELTETEISTVIAACQQAVKGVA
ncbi:erythromycin biosynthesis sensory transduction protein eryC1 [Pseudomonas sp. HMWF032]|uniref:DegT/DnrJ/EryC1/StrS family aminotransferase n=1 Tax=Pseudomonas sp. HMWF032 TaxID=2056866 RepID=UPI000D3579B3|nr:DegT/DnrJ/EryC1/StrS family aminotransferase [Pseudomonas sp. HMWF032]PTS83633.1 erythromycin biosynthesis sensory transduction protein eryC1 [Pseudomonas sp. HMWF032]PTT84007.1 erythromycin biosynthesis sensory transduction protein eryC1 [Pseudomonas sp. HMWF010]